MTAAILDRPAEAVDAGVAEYGFEARLAESRRRVAMLLETDPAFAATVALVMSRPDPPLPDLAARAAAGEFRDAAIAEIYGAEFLERLMAMTPTEEEHGAGAGAGGD